MKCTSKTESNESSKRNDADDEGTAGNDSYEASLANDSCASSANSTLVAAHATNRGMG